MLGGSRSESATRASIGCGMKNDSTAVASSSKYRGFGANNSVRHFSTAVSSPDSLAAGFRGSADASSLVCGSGRYIMNSPRRGEFMMYLPDPQTKLDASALPLKPAAKLSGEETAVLKWRTELFAPNPRYFDEDATAVLSFFMPQPMLARVAL